MPSGLILARQLAGARPGPRTRRCTGRRTARQADLGPPAREAETCPRNRPQQLQPRNRRRPDPRARGGLDQLVWPSWSDHAMFGGGSTTVMRSASTSAEVFLVDFGTTFPQSPNVAPSAASGADGIAERAAALLLIGGSEV